MKLFRLLGEKGWQHPPRSAEGVSLAASQASLLPPQKVALLFFLAVVGVVFGLFITAYFIRMDLDDWRPMPESGLLWFNTALLFLGSLVLQWTQGPLKSGALAQAKAGLLLGSLLSLGFVYGQFVVWQQMQAGGYYMYNNPANSFFYVLTGLHALHLLGGLWVWTRAGIRIWSGANPEQLRLSVELCALYWHFLLLVWLLLFALLSQT